jgi:hypothetical protein
MIAIADEVEKTPEVLHEAPVTLPVRRLDEVMAAKTPILKWCRPPCERPAELGPVATLRPTA